MYFIPKPASLVANYAYIKDVVAGHIGALEKGCAGSKYVLGGENISYADFFSLLRSLTESAATLIPVPEMVVKGMARLQKCAYKIYGREPFFTLDAVHHLFTNKEFSSEKATAELGYRVTPLVEGLSDTIHFLKTEEAQEDMQHQNKIVSPYFP